MRKTDSVVFLLIILLLVVLGVAFLIPIYRANSFRNELAAGMTWHEVGHILQADSKWEHVVFKGDSNACGGVRRRNQELIIEFLASDRKSIGRTIDLTGMSDPALKEQSENCSSVRVLYRGILPIAVVTIWLTKVGSIESVSSISIVD